jgi:maltose alpha-D-glucosyltransferase/alpha-amylase
VTISDAEQSNSSAILSDRLMLKMFRRIDSGLNPDLEMVRFLTERGFPNIAPVAGYITVSRRGSEPGAVAMAQQFVRNDGDLWSRSLDSLGSFVEGVLASDEAPPTVDTSVAALLRAAGAEAPDLAKRLMAPDLDTAVLLGMRTAELHLALACAPDNPDFAPQPFSPLDQRSFYQSLRNQARQTFQLVRDQLASLPQVARPIAEEILGSEGLVEARYRGLLGARLTAPRIRVHGDYHLGQVLSTGRDIVIVDFEGEPARPLGERRRKRSALVDVAGMIRSFHYAAQNAVLDRTGRNGVRVEDRGRLEPWLSAWYLWASSTFLRAYREAAGSASFVPLDETEFGRLLDALLLDKAIAELGYELNNRPDWARVPLLGIRELLRS